ncbi:hypothetical protein COLSTE_02306 [Collinsella stercoris DSM 13279]|uniref:Uncharacterized protein n=1 Tax=Collinsella stercoris DSM 13279 TaxID=445975 RepID=B6GDW0_9ACTN|nr:hypothetical protein COLSTE_02306 [Collinsella stercoris DSM 13279]
MIRVMTLEGFLRGSFYMDRRESYGPCSLLPVCNLGYCAVHRCVYTVLIEYIHYTRLWRR